MKKCIKCKIEKHVAEFYRRAGALDGYRNTCKDCAETGRVDRRNRNKTKVNEYTRAWNKENKEKIQGYYFKNKYGLSLIDVEQLKIKQDYKCAICSEIKVLNVDHCHRSGKVREMLCTRCNLLLGLVENSENSNLILENSAKYLKKHK